MSKVNNNSSNVNRNSDRNVNISSNVNGNRNRNVNISSNGNRNSDRNVNISSNGNGNRNRNNNNRNKTRNCNGMLKESGIRNLYRFVLSLTVLCVCLGLCCCGKIKDGVQETQSLNGSADTHSSQEAGPDAQASQDEVSSDAQNSQDAVSENSKDMTSQENGIDEPEAGSENDSKSGQNATDNETSGAGEDGQQEPSPVYAKDQDETSGVSKNSADPVDDKNAEVNIDNNATNSEKKESYSSNLDVNGSAGSGSGTYYKEGSSGSDLGWNNSANDGAKDQDETSGAGKDGQQEPSPVYTLPDFVSDNGIPVVIISTDLDIATINASKENVAKGSMTMLGEDGNIIYEGELSSLKGRGSSSWTHTGDQKPYNIKLVKKAELIEGAGAAKKWCLLCYDTYNSVAQNRWIHQNPFLNSVVGFRLYSDIGGAYALSSLPVDLYINEDYRGTYMLTEAIQIDEARVNIRDTKYSEEGSKLIYDTAVLVSDGEETEVAICYSDSKPEGSSGGFILEMDSTSSDKNDCYFWTARGTRFLFKDPDMPSKEQVLSIARYVQEFEDALYAEDGYNSQGKYYTDYFDLESNATFIAAKIFLQDGDLYKKSNYFVIDVDESGCFGKITAGPCWDFDACALIAGVNYKSYAGDKSHWRRNFLAELLDKDDFYNLVKDILETKIVPTAKEYAKDGGFIDQSIEKYMDSRLASQKRWPSGIYFSERDGEDNTLSASSFRETFAKYIDIFAEENFVGDYRNFFLQQAKGTRNNLN